MQVEREDAAVGLVRGPRITAPAPSAKITAVFRPRVETSMAVDWISAPTTSTRRNWPQRMNASAMARAYTKPLH